MRRFACAALAALLSACSAPSPQERIDAAELAQLAPLKQTYSGVVMGFDFPSDTTLIVSLDIQSYMGMDDDAIDAMKARLLAGWRAAWVAAHPGAHALLTVRLIDFVGRTIAQESTRV